MSNAPDETQEDRYKSATDDPLVWIDCEVWSRSNARLDVEVLTQCHHR